MPMFELPNMPGASIGAINIADIFGKGQRTKREADDGRGRARAAASRRKRTSCSIRTRSCARRSSEVESNGIVFLDEIDKICAREGRGGADVSREGVQRDLLPLIEGTTVATKHGAVKTDHILFIASGAFHIARPSDLLPELQGRLPIRVELKSLTEEDFKRILTDTEASLIKQYVALMAHGGHRARVLRRRHRGDARIAAQVNGSVENIGARRLQTVMERVLDDVSFTAADRSGEKIRIDAGFVERHVGDLAGQRRSQPVHPLTGSTAFSRRVWPCRLIAISMAAAIRFEGCVDDSARSDIRRRRPAGTGQRGLRENRRLRRDVARKPFGEARRKIAGILLVNVPEARATELRSSLRLLETTGFA